MIYNRVATLIFVHSLGGWALLAVPILLFFKGPTSRPHAAQLRRAPVPVCPYPHSGTTMDTLPNEIFTAFSFIGFVLCAIPFYWHFKGKRAAIHLIGVFFLRMTM